jgi:hypothetical protein
MRFARYQSNRAPGRCPGGSICHHPGDTTSDPGTDGSADRVLDCALRKLLQRPLKSWGDSSSRSFLTRTRVGGWRRLRVDAEVSNSRFIPRGFRVPPLSPILLPRAGVAAQVVVDAVWSCAEEVTIVLVEPKPAHKWGRTAIEPTCAGLVDTSRPLTGPPGRLRSYVGSGGCGGATGLGPVRIAVPEPR